MHTPHTHMHARTHHTHARTHARTQGQGRPRARLCKACSSLQFIKPSTNSKGPYKQTSARNKRQQAREKPHIQSANALPNHLSETILMKYWGGSGSKTGTKNLSVWSSEENLFFSRKYSWWRIISLSTSSTRIQKASELPWIFSSHWKSGVTVNSTLIVDLWTIKGCMVNYTCVRINWKLREQNSYISKLSRRQFNANVECAYWFP